MYGKQDYVKFFSLETQRFPREIFSSSLLEVRGKAFKVIAMGRPIHNLDKKPPTIFFLLLLSPPAKVRVVKTGNKSSSEVHYGSGTD